MPQTQWVLSAGDMRSDQAKELNKAVDILERVLLSRHHMNVERDFDLNTQAYEWVARLSQDVGSVARDVRVVEHLVDDKKIEEAKVLLDFLLDEIILVAARGVAMVEAIEAQVGK